MVESDASSLLQTVILNPDTRQRLEKEHRRAYRVTHNIAVEFAMKKVNVSCEALPVLVE